MRRISSGLFVIMALIQMTLCGCQSNSRLIEILGDTRFDGDMASLLGLAEHKALQKEAQLSKCQARLSANRADAKRMFLIGFPIPGFAEKNHRIVEIESFSSSGKVTGVFWFNMATQEVLRINM